MLVVALLCPTIALLVPFVIRASVRARLDSTSLALRALQASELRLSLAQLALFGRQAVVFVHLLPLALQRLLGLAQRVQWDIL